MDGIIIYLRKKNLLGYFNLLKFGYLKKIKKRSWVIVKFLYWMGELFMFNVVDKIDCEVFGKR